MNDSTLQIVIFIANLILAGIVGALSAIFTIGKYKEKVDRTETDIKDIKSDTREIRDKVIACETSIKERGPLTRRKSPIDLTERGEKVLEESQGKKFIDDHYEELKRKVEENNPQTSYDFQEFSKKVVGELRDDERINPIKEYLFKEGMELDDIIEVLGIYLRNLILHEKNIAVEDIDKYEQSK